MLSCLLNILNPTLQVTQKLYWTRHELASWIEELETLDKTCLKAVKEMYTEKHCPKQWHNQNLQIDKFHKGTLVLVYTPKTT